jgi:pimeloyl-ACP methyl ester carboxylesterase
VWRAACAPGPRVESNTKERAVATQTKPSIVFVHGIWADGSCFSKVIPTLQAEGYEVVSSQHRLDTLKRDVATVIYISDWIARERR